MKSRILLISALALLPVACETTGDGENPNFIRVMVSQEKFVDADGKELYHITEPVLSFREANELELVVNYTITISMWFAGNQFPSANIPIEVTSILTEKF